jgi:uncharacterized membrane protein (DUF2068 family)
MQIEPNKPTVGLRLIAILEAAKGLVGLLLGVALFAATGHHSHPFFQAIVRHLQLTESAHAPHFVIEMLLHPESFRMEAWTGLAMTYAALRFTEAYGLWLARGWGEWLALLSAALYIPFEIYAISLGVSFLKVSLLVMNAAFVVYLTMILIATRRRRAADGAVVPPSLGSDVGRDPAGK